MINKTIYLNNARVAVTFNNFEHLNRQSDEFIAGISKFEARVDDVSNYTADILLTNGRKLEYKSWKKNSFSSLMKKDQFKNQLKNYIKDGDFEYIIDRRKLLNDGVTDPDAFVKGEFQKVFKENAKELFELNPGFFRKQKGIDGKSIEFWDDLLNFSNSSEFTQSDLIKAIIKLE
jgi:hypothetical protein